MAVTTKHNIYSAISRANFLVLSGQIITLGLVVFLLTWFVKSWLVEAVLVRQENLTNARSQLIDKPVREFLDRINDHNKLTVASPIDCVAQDLNCVSNEDCQTRCILGLSPYVCHAGRHMCVLANNIDLDANTPTCNPKHGIIALYRTIDSHIDSRHPQSRCMSLYRDYFDDDDAKIDSACKNGTLAVDILTDHRGPSYLDCTCPDNTYKMVGSLVVGGHDSNSDRVPRCVVHPWLYSDSYMIVSKN